MNNLEVKIKKRETRKMRKNFISKSTQLFVLISIIMAFTAMPLIANAGTKKVDLQVWTAYEGTLKLSVKEGQKIKKGQLLFYVEAIDPNMYPEHFAQLEHEVYFARLKYDRYKKLVKVHSVSEELYQDAWEKYVAAVDELKMTKANFKRAHYYAQYDGTVKNILYPNNSGIGDGNPVLTIVKS
jgi:multidrug resistance efflux pump